MYAQDPIHTNINMYDNFSYSFDEDFKVSANRFFIVKIYTPCFVLGVSSELQHNN